MFGFSLTKVIFTVLIVFGVWQLFRYLGRLQDQRAESIRMGRGARAKDRTKDRAAGAASVPDEVEDMILCPTCGAYVARGAKSCGREDCPYRG